MLIDNKTERVISSLGWVDRGSLWTFSLNAETPQTIPISDAKYLSLKQGCDDTFAVVHHFDGNRLEVSAHRFAEAGQAVSRVSFLATSTQGSLKQPRVSIEGDTSIWSLLPCAYTAYAFGDFHLFNPLGAPAMERLDWYDDSYDKGYQGITDVVEVPGTEYVIVSVQRDSNPVLYDRGRRQVVRKLKLAGKFGNPHFLFRPNSTEIWASDYDSIVKLDGTTYEVVKSVRLQDSVAGASQFVGSFCFASGGDICVVARPFSSDVVVLDSTSMSIVREVKLEGQPLDAAVLLDGLVVARDWKTGALAQGKLSRRKRWLL
jgi:hypothetical protein